MSVSPSSGQVGTLVTIMGTNLLLGGDNVTVTGLGSGDANILSSNNTVILLVAVAGPFSAASGSIVVTANTGANITELNAWMHLERGNILCEYFLCWKLLYVCEI